MAIVEAVRASARKRSHTDTIQTLNYFLPLIEIMRDWNI
jgi:hypothetical protein